MSIIPRQPTSGNGRRSEPLPDYISASDLSDHGIPVEVLRHRAVEHVGLDGQPVWLAEDIELLLAEEGML